MHTPLVSAFKVGDRWALRALYPLVKEGAPLTWVDVAMEGSWEGHPAGPFSFDRATFEQCVANFEAQRNPVPLDYEHATEWAAQAPASGWVQKLAIKDDASGRAHLWALVELTDEAAAFVKDGRYRYSSGVFQFGAIDRASGKDIGCRFTSLALTNTPFLDGQEPIRLSARALGSPAGAAGIEAARTQYTTTRPRKRLAQGASNMSAAPAPTMKIAKADVLEAMKRLQGDEFTDEQLDAVLKGIAAERGEDLSIDSDDEPDADDAEAMADPPPPMPPAGAAPMGDDYAALSDEQKKAFAEDPAVSDKIAKLVKEGKDPKQAAAEAYAMQKAGKLSDKPAGAVTLDATATPPPNSQPAAMAPEASDPNALVCQQLMTLTGLDAGALLAALQQNADAIKAAFSGGAASQAQVPSTLSDDAVTALKLTLSAHEKAHVALKAENETLRARVAKIDEADATAAVDRVIAEGRALDAAKPELLSLALSDRKRFDALAAALPQVVPLAPHALSVTPPGDNAASDVPINEKDPFVKAMRRNLSEVRMPREKQDATIRAALSQRANAGKPNGATTA